MHIVCAVAAGEYSAMPLDHTACAWKRAYMCDRRLAANWRRPDVPLDRIVHVQAGERVHILMHLIAHLPTQVDADAQIFPLLMNDTHVIFGCGDKVNILDATTGAQYYATPALNGYNNYITSVAYCSKPPNVPDNGSVASFF